MRRTICTALAAATVAFGMTGVAFGEMAIPPATNDPGKVPSGQYKLNTEHSQVIFSVLHLGVSPYYGRILKPTGMLDLDAAKPENSKISVDIDMSTVTTTVGVLDNDIKGDKGFNVAQFPKATFQSTAVRRTGPKSADVTGNLSFRGVTKPVTLHVSFVGGMQMPWANNAWEIGFSVVGSFKRSDFSMGGWNSISDEVQLMIEGEFGQNQ